MFTKNRNKSLNEQLEDALEEVKRLEARLEVEQSDNAKLLLENTTLAADLEEAQKPTYLVLTDDDRVIHVGDHKGKARNAGNNYFWNTPGHPHTRLIDTEGKAIDSTRKSGYVQKEGKWWPEVSV